MDGNTLAFPILEEVIDQLPIAQGLLYLLNYVKNENELSSLLSTNFPRMSLYDLQEIKVSENSNIKHLVDKEIRRRLNTNVYDELRDYFDIENLDYLNDLDDDEMDDTDNIAEAVIEYTSDLDYMYELYLFNPQEYFPSCTHNRHITMEFLEDHPDLIQSQMARNKAITQEYFIDNVDKFGDHAYYLFSRNPNMTKEFFLNNYQNRKYDYEVVAKRDFITLDVLKQNRKLFKQDQLYEYFNISVEEFEGLNPDNSMIQFFVRNKNATLKYLREVIRMEDISIECILSCASNPNINMEFIVEYLEMLRRYVEDDWISRGFKSDKYRESSIQASFEQYKYLVFEDLTVNKGISIQDILKHPEFPWDKSIVNSRLDVTETMLGDPEYPYKDELLNNMNITAEYIRENNINPYRYDIYPVGYTQNSKYVKLAESILNM